MVRENTTVRVVRKPKRWEIFEESHKGHMAGHLSGRKLYRQLKRERMQTDITKWSKERPKCFLSNAHQIHTPPLKPFTSSAPCELIGIDLVELGQTGRRNRYLLVVVDHFTKFAGAYAIPDKTARNTCSVWALDLWRLQVAEENPIKSRSGIC